MAIPIEDAWRPFEPSRDALKEIEREAERNMCNLHDDCAAADEKVKTAGGRPARVDGWANGKYVKAGELVMIAFHCSIEDCEDCFGC
jgi:hypothetical protein